MTSGTISTGDRCRIAWRWDGPPDAPVLLLSNSLGTSMGMWDSQLNDWTQEFRVLRYDSRGHGASDAPAGAYSLDRLGRDVLELLDELDVTTIDFCGLSMGGMIGQWLAARAPARLRRLVLANTSACMAPPEAWQTRIDRVTTEGMGWLVDASLERWFTPGFIANEADAIMPIRRMLLETGPGGYAGCCAAIRDMDLRPVAALNGLPTLVIAGEHDPATPVADSIFLVENAANARLATLPAAHLSNVEAAEAFSNVVLRFLHEA